MLYWHIWYSLDTVHTSPRVCVPACMRACGFVFWLVEHMHPSINPIIHMDYYMFRGFLWSEHTRPRWSESLSSFLCSSQALCMHVRETDLSQIHQNHPTHQEISASLSHVWLPVWVCVRVSVGLYICVLVRVFTAFLKALGSPSQRNLTKNSCLGFC